VHKLALALAISLALALPVLAQQKKGEPAKATANPNLFLKAQIKGQSLARERFLGAKVLGTDNQTIGTIDDLIIGANGTIDGVIMGVGGYFGVGETKIGVRMSALKITTAADGKTTISMPGVTKEMLGTVEAYQKAGAAKK
jgi:hypothetical protein